MARRRKKRKKTDSQSQKDEAQMKKEQDEDIQEIEIQPVAESDDEGLLSEEELEDMASDQDIAEDEDQGSESEEGDNSDDDLREDDAEEEEGDEDDGNEGEEVEIEISSGPEGDEGLLEGEVDEKDVEDEESADITIEKLEKLDKGMKVIEIDIAKPEADSHEDVAESTKTVVEPHILKTVVQEEEPDTVEDATVSQVNIDQAGSLAEQLEAIDYLFLRINETAIKKLFESAQFRALFENSDLRNTVIMHINLRRSADLMLHAKNPLLYLDFMMKLESSLREIIIANYGVFEKFTGDGLIAFFPDFYSGKEAMCFAQKAADECQAFFKDHYEKYRNSFSTVVLEAGLCIGIDFGKANIIKVNEELMSVGEPVVNARKMSSGKAGETILNQAAYDELRRRHKGDLNPVETEIDFSGKGRVLGYKVDIDWTEAQMSDPDWDALMNAIAKEK